MVYYQRGGVTDRLTDEDLKVGLFFALDKIGMKKRVLAIPPDFTRFHSHAGLLTRFAWEYYQNSLTDVLPAIGTHHPMSDVEIQTMFPSVPRQLFRVHDWRNGTVTLGTIPADFIQSVSEHKLNYSWPAQVARLLVEGRYDLILSFGQVVPHEVAGMASYNKNIFVGTGGAESINKSHFLGAAYGMEHIMGRADNPVRKVLNYATDHFAHHLPIVYVLTVVSRDQSGHLIVRGLFIGDDIECFNLASELSLQVNFERLEKPLQKVIVYLEPGEYKSTWLGNKSIYRTRMAIADGGELIVLAPGVRSFGEDKEIDRLIRKYGYVGSARILEMVQYNEELRQNLGVAAHLIHGSSEGRFAVIYCPGKLTREEVEAVGFRYSNYNQMIKKYPPSELVDGFNTLPNGETIFFISNPALGLWSHKERFA
ncbi:MAG: lactate racemase domain-containing protein [candidate division KSB1 bacterium]|nr:lactate racemase domain-containing protein [candidate division KSB1 bacterium]MDZ7336632.1 lactate racemase domain-containing protein [candidate division KSB1 bacterium]MDZ7376139.1 lactate racemase domain-containing protein [candidate division KSB1 bacterium]MDZ7401118.1 lactate racemase domain-containing protein [candidate division KSB1 bacterium]